MKKELIKDIVDDHITVAVDEVILEFQRSMAQNLNLAYEKIRHNITESYYDVANGSPTVNVKTAFDFIIAEINKKYPKNSKRQYRAGYFMAVKDIEKIMLELTQIWGVNG